MILVLGATGTTGSEVARQLIAAGHRPRLLARTPGKAAALADHAEIAVGDLADPASLAAAMDGIEQVYLVSTGPDLAALEANAIDAARRAGVRHVVQLSVLGADRPAFALARWHAAAERHLVDSGLSWTMLRPTNFATNALGWADTVRTEGAVYQPTGTGKWAAIDPADIGAVAVHALTTPGHEGKTYPITGPESLDAAGYAATLAAVLGRPVRFVDVPPAAAREGMRQAGVPAPFADAVLELDAATAAGGTDGVTSTVPDLLGRPATSFETWARRNAAAFGGVA